MKIRGYFLKNVFRNSDGGLQGFPFNHCRNLHKIDHLRGLLNRPIFHPENIYNFWTSLQMWKYSKLNLLKQTMIFVEYDLECNVQTFPNLNHSKNLLILNKKTTKNASCTTSGLAIKKMRCSNFHSLWIAQKWPKCFKNNFRIPFCLVGI